MNDFGNRPPRQKYDVSALGITCADCGQAINELPFNPTKRDDGTFGRLYCGDCNRKRYQNRDRSSGGGGGFRRGY
ncbi:MAG: hypothetical protein A2939_00335 [Parcubacteria group bacterium RIFCSPLOWO2_01_FULL_48_18]|nr:MAG: hypothetical protein A2939_00335 [Parcubacteria group bacterium RIFCSPLOWO2_01_FULL_48_18]